MHAKRFAVVVFIICVAASPLSAADKSIVPAISPVEAQLTIPDAQTLPGVPLEMWIDVRNQSAATVGIGLCADMLVEPERGEPFSITFGGESRPPYPVLLEGPRHQPEWYLELKPRQRQTLTIPILEGLNGPAYFEDHRLASPGRYSVTIRLDHCWGGYTPQKALLPTEFLGAVSTNTVVIERVRPTGQDAAVWERMQSSTGAKWAAASWTLTENGRSIVQEIIDQFEDSNYFPYAVLASSVGTAAPVQHARVLDALSRFPNSPVNEWLEVAAWGTSTAREYNERWAKVSAAKRPTTRRKMLGREDLPPSPCGPETECDD